MVIRVERTEGFTVMSNYHLRDNRLSLKAIGLLSKMLSLPENWDYTEAGLVSVCQEGRSAIRATLKELQDAGYITRARTRGEGGTFSGVDYIVRERPTPEDDAQPLFDFQTMDGTPLFDFPTSDNPTSENRTQINTKINKDLNNKPPIPPQGGRERKEKSTPKHEPERFERFWQAYPRHEGRQKAIAAWDKLHADPGLLDRMARSLSAYLRCPDWTRGIGIPYASTWINGKRWDELPYIGPAHEQGGWAPEEERY